MYNRSGHPRAQAISSALSVANRAPLPRQQQQQEQEGGGGLPPQLVALRYRGAAVLLDNVGSASDIEATAEVSTA
jgi:hypothetical protein